MAKWITVTTFYKQHPGVVAKEVKQATKEGHLAMGEIWRDQLAPEHFEPNARYVFGYQPRTQKYLKRKRILGETGKAEDGGNTDLVLTGRARRMVRNATVTATPNKTTVRHFMPVYFGRPPRSSSPIMRMEMLRISRRQEKILSKEGADAFRNRMRQINAPAKKVT